VRGFLMPCERRCGRASG